MLSTTTLIIIATCVTSLAAMDRQNIMPESLQRPEWMQLLRFNAFLAWHKRQVYRLFSHGLIHADLIHLAFNMLTLYFFGDMVEQYLQAYFGTIAGKIIYILMYISAVAVSSSVDLVRHKDNPAYNAVGASGAISAVLFAGILFNPSMRISLLFLPIPAPAWVFGIVYLAFCFYMARRGGDNIGHTAHAVGAIYGFILPVILKPMIFMAFLKTMGLI